MKRIRYVVAMSLDGYIAGPNGEADWIVSDPDVNFAELWSQFDTLLMGRRTYEPALARVGKGAFAGKKAVVASRTLRPEDYPDVTVVAEVTADFLQGLRAQSKKDIWLFGGGKLFRTLLDMRQIDTVEVSIMPLVLGGGISLLPSPAGQARLKLAQHKIYRSGIVSLIYEVQK